MNRFDEGIDVAGLTKDEGRGREGVVAIGEIGIELRVRWLRIDGDSGGIVPSVLQTAEAIEQNLKNEPPVSVDIVIQIRENSTHLRREIGGF